MSSSNIRAGFNRAPDTRCTSNKKGEKMKKMSLPSGKKFVFTIIDDTDDATLENIFRTTKTVWVYPPRDKESFGHSLMDEGYREFVCDIYRKGFEIGLHNVGSGEYFREEILKGLEEFRSIVGEYPRIQINHAYNPDSIYGGYKRFSFPFDELIKMLHPIYANNYKGEVKDSPYFWGDKHKQVIKYSRNYETDRLNTFSFNPYMPYVDKRKSEYSNHWFSSTFAPNQWMFNRIVTRSSIDKLERDGGVCILNTHLGYYMKNGSIDSGFVERIKYLSKKRTGWFVPVSTVLDHMRNTRDMDVSIPLLTRYRMELSYLLTRFKYRKILKIDDYFFKRA